MRSRRRAASACCRLRSPLRSIALHRQASSDRRAPSRPATALVRRRWRRPVPSRPRRRSLRLQAPGRCRRCSGRAAAWPPCAWTACASPSRAWPDDSLTWRAPGAGAARRRAVAPWRTPLARRSARGRREPCRTPDPRTGRSAPPSAGARTAARRGARPDALSSSCAVRLNCRSRISPIALERRRTLIVGARPAGERARRRWTNDRTAGRPCKPMELGRMGGHTNNCSVRSGL
jgi:hypothetical protein